MLKIYLNSVTATELHQKMQIRPFLLSDSVRMWLNVNSEDCLAPKGFYQLLSCVLLAKLPCKFPNVTWFRFLICKIQQQYVPHGVIFRTLKSQYLRNSQNSIWHESKPLYVLPIVIITRLSLVGRLKAILLKQRNLNLKSRGPNQRYQLSQRGSRGGKGVFILWWRHLYLYSFNSGHLQSGHCCLHFADQKTGWRR